MLPFLTFTGAVEREAAIDHWIDAQPDALARLARRWFTTMRDCGDDVRELMHDGCATVCVQDAPYAYVSAHAAHINVGFFHGADLPDPTALLEGKGKRMRHVKLKPGAVIDEAALQKLIVAAYRDIVAKLKAHAASAGGRAPSKPDARAP